MRCEAVVVVVVVVVMMMERHANDVHTGFVCHSVLCFCLFSRLFLFAFPCLELDSRSYRPIDSLDLSDNRFTGTIPTEFGNMSLLSKWILMSTLQLLL